MIGEGAKMISNCESPATVCSTDINDDSSDSVK